MAFQVKTVLVAVFTAAAMTAAHAADVPNLNVERTCHDAARDNADVKFDADRCLKSEYDARDQLVREWTEFTPAGQSQCTQTATMGGTASYVQLITCLELKRDVARLPVPAESVPQIEGRR